MQGEQLAITLPSIKALQDPPAKLKPIPYPSIDKPPRRQEQKQKQQ
jgi:hypothetical protein